MSRSGGGDRGLISSLRGAATRKDERLGPLLCLRIVWSGRRAGGRRVAGWGAPHSPETRIRCDACPRPSATG